MKEKRRCSILFHLLVPGGRWLTMMSRPSSLASFCNSRFHSRTPEPLLPRPHAVAPPRADALDGDRGRVVINADTHPTGIGGEVVDPVRYRAAELLDQEGMEPD